MLRGILEKAPDLRMETAELLKAVNASISSRMCWTLWPTAWNTCLSS